MPRTDCGAAREGPPQDAQMAGQPDQDTSGAMVQAGAVTTRDAAIAAAERGWAVFPCVAAGKRPAVDRWEQRACADPERVARHWPSGRHNVGVACGPSGLVVIDLDAHGELPPGWQLPGLRDGRDVLAQLCEWAGQPWPDSHMVATPSGGWHMYYRAPAGLPLRNTAGAIGPQIDTRAAGGYVVGAGSVIGGLAYEVLDDRDPEPLPAWLARLLTPRRAAPDAPLRQHTAGGPANLAGLVQTVRDSQPGAQTDTLAWAAFRLRDEICQGRASGDDAELLVQAALQAGMRPESYVRYQVTHVMRSAR